MDRVKNKSYEIDVRFKLEINLYARFAFSLTPCIIIFQSSAGITEGFSMCGGDFVEVYSDPSQVGKQLYKLTAYMIKIPVKTAL